ncbi:MAG: SUF system Fe-S cluster assembly regulator [Candidatus Sumerlaeaceae bacterium]|nr:SUF system Fe-S cluster assembly regulator [Candidatus Sumerlaeaceae bacterium]
MIRLAKLTDYGFVVLTYFVQSGPSKVHAAKDVAANAKLPLPTVSKLLKTLSRSGILIAHRGMKGGYQLARPAAKISVAEIVEALEGPVALTDCISGEPTDCMVEPHCPVRGKWARINMAIQDALERVSLAELATPVPPRRPAGGTTSHAHRGAEADESHSCDHLRCTGHDVEAPAGNFLQAANRDVTEERS